MLCHAAHIGTILFGLEPQQQLPPIRGGNCCSILLRKDRLLRQYGEQGPGVVLMAHYLFPVPSPAFLLWTVGCGIAILCVLWVRAERPRIQIKPIPPCWFVR